MPDSDPESGELVGGGGGVRNRAAQLMEQLSPDLLARIQHAGFLFIGMLTCMLLKGSNGQLVSMSGKLAVLERGCEMLKHLEGGAAVVKESTALNVACYENTVVYRISFSLFLFYLLHFISVSDLTCCVSASVRAQLQTRFVCLKTAVLALLSFLAFLIPNAFFAYYAWACMFAGAVFLLAQVVILVDWSHHWNEEWGDRAERNGKWQWYLLAIAAGTFVFGVVMTGVNYYYFVPHENCNLNGFLITLTLLCAIAYTVVAIWVPHGSIVPSGIVFAYTVAIGFSTMRATQDPTCNRLYTDLQHPSMRMMLITTIFSSVLLTYAVISVGGSRGSLTLATETELAQEDADEEGHLSGYCYFYAIMMLGSMYLSMMVTDWQVSGGSDSGGHTQGVSASLWVKIATIALTIFLYFWSLLAPYFCCKDRDFGFDTDWD